MRICKVTDCERKHYGAGLCNLHWNRWRKHGDVNAIGIGHRYTEIDAGERLRKHSHQDGDCVIYHRGKPSRSGHRTITFHGKLVGAHRVAWILANGEVPEGLYVLHRCDVGSCINPAHLFLGTIADNNRDRDLKGRHVSLPGSRNGGAKLSEHQIIEIRDFAAQGLSQRAIADRYEITQTAVWSILNSRGWLHVRGGAEYRSKARIPWTEAEMATLHGRPDLSNAELAALLGKTKPAVQNMRSRLRRKAAA